jgi:putative Mg2+ transporter-C (MgtC) family protein
MLDPREGSFWVRVGIAVFCGGVVGFERQFRGKPAGIRTSILVCVGTMVFVRLGVELEGKSADPTRVLAQVVTGVGFLGAGVILTRGGLVQGVTSAAVIWMLAAIGSAIGVDRYASAIALSVVTVCVLLGVQALEKGFRALRRGVHAHDDRTIESDESEGD